MRQVELGERQAARSQIVVVTARAVLIDQGPLFYDRRRGSLSYRYHREQCDAAAKYQRFQKFRPTGAAQTKGYTDAATAP